MCSADHTLPMGRLFHYPLNTRTQSLRALAELSRAESYANDAPSAESISSVSRAFVQRPTQNKRTTSEIGRYTTYYSYNPRPCIIRVAAVLPLLVQVDIDVYTHCVRAVFVYVGQVNQAKKEVK